MKTINNVATLTNVNGVGVIAINFPPVNALSASVRERSFREIWDEGATFRRLREADGEAFGGGCRARSLALGSNRLVIAFRAPIAAAGASIIRARDATDGADYLYTLLVPSDANLLFPCFDQPDLKARVSVLFDQATWDSVTYADAVTGSVAPGTYNDILAPLVVTNNGGSAGTYQLLDTPLFGAGTTVVSAS